MTSSSTNPRAVLSAVSTYLPEGFNTNAELEEEFPDFDAKRTEASTGVASRRVADPSEFSSDLALKAAQNLFAEDPSRREGIDFLIMVTVTPDYLIPSTGAIIQSRLELPTSVGAIDICLACSGYPYALNVAGGMLESRRASKVLLLTADRFSAYLEYGYQGVKALFGDAGTATLIERAEPDEEHPGGSIGACRYGTDGSGYRHLIAPTSACKGVAEVEETQFPKPTLEMNGSHVFDFTMRVVPGHIQDILDAGGLTLDEVDVFVFHQANLFMLNHLRRRLKIPEEKFVVFISDVGNTGASTIPLALNNAMEAGRIQPGARVLLVGYGTGFSWSSTLLTFGG